MTTTSETPTVATGDEVAARLARREIIDRAKIILMSVRGMTEPEAYRWIQKNAMDTRCSMTVIASHIIDAVGIEQHENACPDRYTTTKAS